MQRSLEHHLQIGRDLGSINSRIQALAYSFKELEASNNADVELITIMLGEANALIPAAQALLTIAYDPTPNDPEPAP